MLTLFDKVMLVHVVGDFQSICAVEIVVRKAMKIADDLVGFQ